MTIEKLWYQLGFAIARSLRYHAKRRAFFERCNHLTRALSAIAGAGTVASVIQGSYILSIIAGSIVGIATSLDLVFDFSARAMIYDGLYRRFADLGIKVASEEATDAKYRELIVERLVIERDEPTVLIVLDAICFNEELKSRGFEYSYKINNYQKAFCQIFNIGGAKIEQITHGA